MGRFIVEGMIVGEPVSTPLKNGGALMRIRVEERNSQGGSTTHEIEFYGKMCDRIPKFALNGCQAAVTGVISSKDWNGRNYHDLFGDGIVIISHPSYGKGGQASYEPPESEPSEDDLPF